MFHHARLWTAALIITGVIIVGFVLSVPRVRELAEAPVTPGTSTSTPSITLRDSFKKGTHTLTGSVEAPDACTPVTATASLSGDASSTPRILLALSLPQNTKVCLQIPTKVTFSTLITAPADARIEITVNGAMASTTTL